MARPLRIQYPGAVYHVTARGNERKPIVRDDKDRHSFLNVLEEATEHFQVIVHAWVLMENH
jgi:putative transposase